MIQINFRLSQRHFILAEIPVTCSRNRFYMPKVRTIATFVKNAAR
jgi:hypothetical protein